MVPSNSQLLLWPEHVPPPPETAHEGTAKTVPVSFGPLWQPRHGGTQIDKKHP